MADCDADGCSAAPGAGVGVRSWLRGDTRIAVFVLWSYFVLSVCWAAPGSLLPYIAAELDLDSADSARLSAIATVSSCLAKLSMGQVVDRVGGKHSALLSLSGVALTLYMLGKAWSAWSVAVIWFCIAWTNAPMWPAEAVVMRENFRPEAIDGYFRLLSIASRMGIFCGMGFFSALLTVMKWRSVCTVTAILGVVTVVGTSPLISARRGRRPERSPSGVGGMHGCRAVCGELVTVLRKPWYMWAALAMCGLMTTLNLGYLITTFFADTVTATDSENMLMSSSFPAGILACMIFPAHGYSCRDHAGRQRLCVGLMWLSLAGVIVLALGFSGEATTRLEVVGKVVFVFMTTFGLGIAYYIPLHAATVTLAPEHAGFCNSSLDGIGYVVSIFFQMIASYVLETSARWRGVWLMAAVCVAGSIFAMNRFYDAVLVERGAGGAGGAGSGSDNGGKVVHGGSGGSGDFEMAVVKKTSSLRSRGEESDGNGREAWGGQRESDDDDDGVMDDLVTARLL